MTTFHIASRRVIAFAAHLGIKIIRDGHGMWLAEVAGGWQPIGRTNYDALNGLARIPRIRQAELGLDTEAK